MGATLYVGNAPVKVNPSLPQAGDHGELRRHFLVLAKLNVTGVRGETLVLLATLV